MFLHLWMLEDCIVTQLVPGSQEVSRLSCQPFQVSPEIRPARPFAAWCFYSGAASLSLMCGLRSSAGGTARERCA